MTKTDITVGKGKNESAVTGNTSVRHEAKPEEVNSETRQAEIAHHTTSGGPSNSLTKVEASQESRTDNKQETKN